MKCDQVPISKRNSKQYDIETSTARSTLNSLSEKIGSELTGTRSKIDNGLRLII